MKILFIEGDVCICERYARDLADAKRVISAVLSRLPSHVTAHVFMLPE